MDIVEVEGLIKDYPVHRGLRQTLRHPLNGPTKRVLDGVDLKVAPGEVLGILGENSAGKTTLLKIIATFVTPSQGAVRVDGLDVGRYSQHAKSLVAYSFAEDRSFYWRLSGKENLQFCAALDNLHGAEAAREIQNLAQRLDLDEFMDQTYSTYSAGIRQRFALARVLLRRPKILLLDEPTRSVDSREASRIWSFLREELVEQQGMTILLVTHQVEEAVALCDRISVLEKGKLQAHLRPRDLARAADGLHGVTLTLTGLRQSDVLDLRVIKGVKDLLLSEQDGRQQLEVWSENGDLSMADLIARATGSGAQLHSLVEGTPVHEMVRRLVRNGDRHP